MPNEKAHRTIDFLLKSKDVLFAATTIIVVLLNLWLASKLAPVAQDISRLESKVLANEDALARLETDFIELDEKIWEELRYLRTRVDSIYNIIK